MCIAPKAGLDLELPDFQTNLSAAGVGSGCDFRLYNEWDELGAFDELDPVELFPDLDPSHLAEVGSQSASQAPSAATPVAVNADGENAVDSWLKFPEEQWSCQLYHVPAPLRSLIGRCAYEAHSILGALNCTGKHSIMQDDIRTTRAELSSKPCENAILRLDNILQRSKLAVTSVTRLLDCSCAQEPHLAMLYASIVSKVLSWYQVAAHHLPPATTRATLAAPPRSALSTSNLDAFGLQAHSSAGIRFGSFQLDDAADQAVLHKQLLLIEIGKVDGLIDKMVATLRQQSRPEGDLAGAMGWCDSSCQAIRAKVREIKDLITQQH